MWTAGKGLIGEVRLDCKSQVVFFCQRERAWIEKGRNIEKGWVYIKM